MGMYPPRKRKIGGQIKVPIRVRRELMGDKVELMEEWVGIPVFNYISPSHSDDMNDCAYASSQFDDAYHNHSSTIFSSLSLSLLPLLLPELGLSLNLTPSAISALTFTQAYRLCDVLKAETFEGIP